MYLLVWHSLVWHGRLARVQTNGPSREPTGFYSELKTEKTAGREVEMTSVLFHLLVFARIDLCWDPQCKG